MMFNIQFECNAQYNIYFTTKQFILFFYLEQNGKLSFEFYKRLYDRGHEPELASPSPPNLQTSVTFGDFNKSRSKLRS